MSVLLPSPFPLPSFLLHLSPFHLLLPPSLSCAHLHCPGSLSTCLADCPFVGLYKPLFLSLGGSLLLFDQIGVHT